MTNKEYLLAALPQQCDHINRLVLLINDGLPTITVVGKYNHGKSSLLNALTGKAAFSVADKRETRSLQKTETQGVIWLDAPGLDADIQSIDDEYAHQATWLESDIRLFVHAVREGELDAAELKLLQALLVDEKNSHRAVIFVLSQADQAASDDALATILENIKGQLNNGLAIIAVSTVRYQRGLEREQPLFIEKSGMPELQQAVNKAIAQVPAARKHEQSYLFELLTAQLEQLHNQRKSKLQSLEFLAQAQERAFDEDLHQVLEQANCDLQDIMQEPESDPALDPGTIGDVYKVTAGKIERSKIQNAYSRACIHIRSVLTRHGVVALPQAQQTGAKGLDTVMVAVLGVSVKYRADLRRLFGNAKGRARLFADFKSYYVQSQDYLYRQQAITAQKEQVQEVVRASKELKQWQKLAK